MIQNRTEKIQAIASTIQNEIGDINRRYRSGPDLYFYKRLCGLRRQYKDIESFLAVDSNIEIIYATLVAWDMNGRGAKMKYYDEFKSNFVENIELFKQIEEYDKHRANSSVDIVPVLAKTYERMNLMKTGGRLVSNSKCLHFLFPKLVMPMDRLNTLTYLYGNTGESPNKFMEIFRLAQEIEAMPVDWAIYLDNNWNVSVPKMIDNAIIMLVGESVK